MRFRSLDIWSTVSEVQVASSVTVVDTVVYVYVRNLCLRLCLCRFLCQ